MIISSLQQTLGVHFVGLFFDVTEVVGLGFFVAQAFLAVCKNGVVGCLILSGNAVLTYTDIQSAECRVCRFIAALRSSADRVQ